MEILFKHQDRISNAQTSDKLKIYIIDNMSNFAAHATEREHVTGLSFFSMSKWLNNHFFSFRRYTAYRVAEMAGKEVLEKVVIISAGVGMNKTKRKEMVEREGGGGYDILFPTKADDLMELMCRSMFKAPKWFPRFLLTDFIQVMYRDRREEKKSS